MAEYIKTNNLAVVKDKKIFFDANIWIFIFCEIASSKSYLVNIYSTAFRNLLRAGNPIYIDFAVISEFVNRYLRISFSNYKAKNNLDEFEYKKDYRKTDDFKEAWGNVCNIVKNRILLKANTINFKYDKSSFEKLLNSSNLDIDFNDNHIMNLCRTNNMYLLTHDGDFKNTDINIITENKYYWKK